MKQTLVLTLFFVILGTLLTSCKPLVMNREMENEFYQYWPSAFSFQLFVKENEVILKPAGIKTLVLSGIIYKEVGPVLECLFYRPSFKGIVSSLTLEISKPLKAYNFNKYTCQNIGKLSKSFAIEGVTAFKVNSSKENEMVISFFIDKRELKWKFPIFNTTFNPEKFKYKVKHKKFSFEKLQKDLPLIHVFPAYELPQNEYLENAICRKVDAHCHIVGVDLCNSCKNGKFLAVNPHCPPEKAPAFCGQNHCGEKGQVACPRGTALYTDEELLSDEVDYADIAFCQRDLKIINSNNDILTCQ